MDPLTRVYVELTTSCNLACRMCVRHAWQDIHGTMSLDTFRRLIEQIADLDDPPTLHLGGYGEPMTHPHFLECVKLAKGAGLRVELTTNGTLLNRIISLALLDLGLDRLVVSIDSVDPAENDAWRTGTCTDEVLENLRELNRLRIRRFGEQGGLQIEIAFVAMRHNIDSLPHLPELARSVGASRVTVSNLIPHMPELESEILYAETLRMPIARSNGPAPEISLPRLDVLQDTVASVEGVLRSQARVSLLDQPLNARSDACPCAAEGYLAVRWDGAISPCLSLLHDHPEYRLGRRLDISQYTVGNMNHRSLADIWDAPDYVDLRARMRAGDFSACPTCALAGDGPDGETACAGCLWAQGLVQVP